MVMHPWEAFYAGSTTGLTAEQFAAKQRALGLENIPWTPEELALPGAQEFAPTQALVPLKGPTRQALSIVPREEDPMGFLPGGFGGGGYDPPGFWGPLGGVLGDIFGGYDRYPDYGPTNGGFLPGPEPDVSVSFPDSGIPTQTWPGRVMVDECGRCFITRRYPARTVRRKARIVGCNAAGPICVPVKPRMNALNPRALTRALRRAKAFAKFARKAVKIQATFKGKAARFSAPRKRKSKACIPCT